MKNRIILILGLILITIFITSCNYNGFNIGSKSKVIENNNDILLSIVDNTLSNKGATIKITNNNENLLRYGPDYSIEIKKNNDWYKIKVSQPFHTILYYLDNNETAEYNINWSPYYGDLPKGEYRLVKNFYFENEENIKSDDFYVTIEFTI